MFLSLRSVSVCSPTFDQGNFLPTIRSARTARLTLTHSALRSSPGGLTRLIQPEKCSGACYSRSSRPYCAAVGLFLPFPHGKHCLGSLTESQTVSAAESVAVYDSETGLTYSQNFALYKADGRGITFRVAIPSDVSSNSAYDAVVQVIVPNDVGWSALAWGGSMTKNPLMVFWRGSNNQPVISPRWAK